MDEKKNIRVLIADDQTLMGDGLKTILELEDDIEVCGISKNGEIAYEDVKRLQPDVVLMDIRMPQMDGVESTRLIKKDFPEVNVIMLTTFDDDEYILQALIYGACGYLLKDIEADKLIEAIHDSVKGNMLLPSNIAAKLALRLKSQEQSNNKSGSYASGPLEPSEQNKKFNLPGNEHFSEREKEIAKMIVSGLTNKQIASKLYITEGTVKNYISGIYRKIDIDDRTQAALYLKDIGF